MKAEDARGFHGRAQPPRIRDRSPREVGPCTSGFTLVPGQYLNISHNGTDYFGAGTHTFGMAARFDVGIGQNIGTAFTTTTIRRHRYNAETAAAAGGRSQARRVCVP